MFFLLLILDVFCDRYISIGCLNHLRLKNDPPNLTIFSFSHYYSKITMLQKCVEHTVTFVDTKYDDQIQFFRLIHFSHFLVFRYIFYPVTRQPATFQICLADNFFYRLSKHLKSGNGPQNLTILFSLVIDDTLEIIPKTSNCRFTSMSF